MCIDVITRPYICARARSRYRTSMKAFIDLSGMRAAPKPTPPLHSSSSFRGVQIRAEMRACWAGTAAVLAGAVAVNSLLWPLHCYALTPYEESKRMVYGPSADGSIRGCPSNVNPNCVSTASINDAYSPAWRATEKSPAASADVLESVVENTVEGAHLIRRMSLQSGAEYRAFAAPSFFGEDVVEFVIKPESVSDRHWEGDQAGPLVTYRSMAGSVKYIWPIQQPLSDFDAQRKRMQQIRTGLGWQIIGCELLECYQ